MKNFSLTFTGLLAILLSCCTNKEVEQLRAENASLKQMIAAASFPFSEEEKINSRKDQFGTLAEARDATKDFRNHAKDSDIVIPVSWRFVRADFHHLVSDTTIQYVRFYPCLNSKIEGDTLRLAMVMVKSDGNDVIGEDNNTMIYNFTQNCPSYCSIENILTSDKKAPAPTVFTKK